MLRRVRRTSVGRPREFRCRSTRRGVRRRTTLHSVGRFLLSEQRPAGNGGELFLHNLVDDPGGAAFYGPKISVQAKDAIGRTWQMSTIQLDFQTPKRFGLEYVGADNERHVPIMIHRALFGSIERFFGVLVEHYAGAFPAWLAPVLAELADQPIAVAGLGDAACDIGAFEVGNDILFANGFD